MTKRVSSLLSAGKRGEDKRNLPERIPLDKCETVKNYRIAEDQRFIMRKGKLTLGEIDGATEIFSLVDINEDMMLVSWTDDTDSFVGRFVISTKTLTTLKTYTGITEPIGLKGYGDWAYSCNGTLPTSSKIVCYYPIGGFLNYDAQSADFLVGETLTAGAGGTATIMAMVDNGPTGILVLSNITGTFSDNGTLTTTSGSATQDGAIYNSYQFTQANCPKAKTLELIENDGKTHLIAGNTSSSKSTSEWSNADLNTGIPFEDWYVSDELKPLPTEGTFSTYGNGLSLNSICYSQGKIYQIYENGISIFHIENQSVDMVGLVQIVRSDYSFAGRGGYKIIATDYGVFYTAKDGIYKITSGFLNGENISEQLRTEEGLFNIDLSNGDIAWDGGKLLYISGAEKSTENNVVLVYDLVFNAWTRDTLSINKFCNVQGTLYAVESNSANIIQLGVGYDDDGSPIDCNIRFRADNGGDETLLLKTRRFYVKGLIPSGETLTCAVHAWSKKEVAFYERKKYYLKGNTITNPSRIGYGRQGYGAPIHTEEIKLQSYNIADKKMKINKIPKYQVELSMSASSYHEIHFAEIEFDTKKKLKNNNFSNTP